MGLLSVAVTDVRLENDMETSGLDLRKLTLDDIINAMRINGIRSVVIDTIKTRMLHCATKQNTTYDDKYVAIVTEWYGSATRIHPADDPTL